MTDQAVEPRPAATLILLRETATQPLQTLMVARHAAMAFAGGALVFPGGRVDINDHTLAEQGDGNALKIAAIRETFEESGILLAYDMTTSSMITIETAKKILEQHRRAVCKGELTFADMMRIEGLIPATDRLIPFAHWITPPSRTKRFDTHFFIGACGENQHPVQDDIEVTKAIWIAPHDLLADAKDETYKLVFATRLNVERLAAFKTVEQAISKVSVTPVVTVRPKTISTPQGIMIRIPPDAGYGGEYFISNDPPAI